MGNAIQSHLGVEGPLGGVFRIYIAVKAGEEKKSGERRNDADQNNHCNKFDEDKALLFIHDKCFVLDTGLIPQFCAIIRLIRVHPCPNTKKQTIYPILNITRLPADR